MKVLTPGHRYELASFEGGPPQTLQFIEKSPGSHVLLTVCDGTTNEEVLAVLIDRINHLQEKGPCQDNLWVLSHLDQALHLLEVRTADRKARGVEGKQVP